MNICVYGASSAKLEPVYYEKQKSLKMIGVRGHGLVFGGGKTGLMGAAARGVSASHGYILGIAPTFLTSRGFFMRIVQNLFLPKP